MKQVIKNYSFSPSSKTVTFSDFSTIRLDRILLITDVTNNITIYQFNSPTLGGTVSTNVLTLDYNTNTGSFNSGDALQIFYDAASGDPIYDLPIVEGNIASGATDSGNPVKVGGVYHTNAPSFSDGQRTDLQADSTGNLKVSANLFNNQTILFAPISVSSSGDNTIVAASATQKIKVLSCAVVSSGIVSMIWKSGSSTTLSGALPLIANSGFILPASSPGGGDYFETAVNQALVINLSSAVAVYGHISYYLQ